MRTLFLHWTQVGNSIYSARDLIDPEIRFIIRPDTGYRKWQGLWVKDGKETIVTTDNTFDCVQWKLVTHRIEQLLAISFENVDYSKSDIIEKARRLFSEMSDSAFSVTENPAIIARLAKA